jgi:hypothetical protein
MALRQEIEHLPEPPHPVAVARDQPTTDRVGRGPESIELGLKDPIGMVEALGSCDRVDQRQHRFGPGGSSPHA